MWFGITQCDVRIIKCEKRITVPQNMTKLRSNSMLVLPNVTMILSNVRKQIMENYGTIECDKSMVTCETISVSF